MNWFSRLYTYHLLKKYALADHLWLETTRQLPLINSLSASEKAHLRVLSTLLIHEKTFSGAQGLSITPRIKVIVATQACLPILKLGLQSYHGWNEIILYPATFVVNRKTEDESGLINSTQNALSGEAWERGPVILSWQDVERDSFQLRPGNNVVIHEFSHKLDMLNGRANGMPPLHPNMPIEAWTESLSNAYQKMKDRVMSQQSVINAYAATDPAEFFAVFCEYFFTAPDVLLQNYPDVFDQLRQYFKQNPLQRKFS